MLRANARTRKPILLLLVFGVFLMIVGITALAQAVLVSTDYSYSMLKAVVGNDAATVRTFANANLLAQRPGDDRHRNVPGRAHRFTDAGDGRAGRLRPLRGPPAVR